MTGKRQTKAEIVPVSRQHNTPLKRSSGLSAVYLYGVLCECVYKLSVALLVNTLFKITAKLVT